MLRRDQTPGHKDLLYLPDASFDAMGDYCQELRVFWRYELRLAFSAELKREAACREMSSVTINLLQLIGVS